MIVADLLVQSERLFQRENFSEAAAKAAEALDIDGDNAQAHYYLGMSRYNLGEYEQSARSLIRAAALGQQVTFPVKHHHIDNGNDNFCSGSLILKSSRVTFRSDQGADHDFTVDRGKIVGLTQEPEKAGRLRVEVLIARRGREDRRTYIFHSPQAYLETLRMPGSSKSMVVANCRDCDGDVEFLFDLLRDE